MQVGTLEVSLVIREARSLKDKRRVVKSIKDRLRQKYNISIAETDTHDLPQQAVLAIAMVGNERRHLESQLTQIANTLATHPAAELSSQHTEFW